MIIGQGVLEIVQTNIRQMILLYFLYIMLSYVKLIMIIVMLLVASLRKVRHQYLEIVGQSIFRAGETPSRLSYQFEDPQGKKISQVVRLNQGLSTPNPKIFFLPVTCQLSREALTSSFLYKRTFRDRIDWPIDSLSCKQLNKN